MFELRPFPAPVLTALVLAASAGSASAGEWSSQTVDGMQARIFTPDADGAVGAGRGLLVVLHGCNQSNVALERRGNFEPAAEAYGVVVALPQVPDGGVIAGCWDYYGGQHARADRHPAAILALVEALAGDPTLGIDRDQVYVAGLSSGAGEAAVLGCLAPDVFVGVGIAAGPAVGTTENQFSFVSTTADQARAVCEGLAGPHAEALGRQVASVIAGRGDFVVAQGYAGVNAGMYAALAAAGGPALEGRDFDVSAVEGYEPAGDGRVWSTEAGPRVSRMLVVGLGHAFPAGSGPGPELSFVATEGPAWPTYLARFFSENNPRLAAAPEPDAGVPADAAAPLDAGSAPAADAGVGVDAGAATDDRGAPAEASGCRCATPRGAGAGLVLVLALPLWARRRER